MREQPPYRPDLEAANDTFMLEEGLELLDQFRSIHDRQMRAAVYQMIRQIVATQPTKPTRPTVVPAAAA